MAVDGYVDVTWLYQNDQNMAFRAQRVSILGEFNERLSYSGYAFLFGDENIPWRCRPLEGEKIALVRF